MAERARKARPARVPRQVASAPMMVGPAPRVGVPVAGEALVRFYHHADKSIATRRPTCGFTWGVMAPPGDGPGVLHWCARPLVEVPAEGYVGAHPGKCRCTCGEYVTKSGRVICQFPIGDQQCGVTVTGTESLQVGPKSRIRLAGRKAPAWRGEIIVSVPCGHPVRRGGDLPL